MVFDPQTPNFVVQRINPFGVAEDGTVQSGIAANVEELKALPFIARWLSDPLFQRLSVTDDPAVLETRVGNTVIDIDGLGVIVEFSNETSWCVAYVTQDYGLPRWEPPKHVPRGALHDWGRFQQRAELVLKKMRELPPNKILVNGKTTTQVVTAIEAGTEEGKTILSVAGFVFAAALGSVERSPA